MSADAPASHDDKTGITDGKNIYVQTYTIFAFKHSEDPIMNKMVNRKVAVSLFAAVVSPIIVSAQNLTVSAGDTNAVLDTIAQINHINWIVNVIKTCNNVLVLEEEYDKISYGNLNLNRIPDEDTLNRIDKALDTLHSLRKDEREMKRWLEDFRDSRGRKVKSYWLKATKETRDALSAQASECQFAFERGKTAGMAAVAQTVFNMAFHAVSLYLDYDNFVYELDKSVKDRWFDFDTAKLDLLHQQNKELLQDQWRFINRYHLDDKLRVSDNDIKRLLDCLKDDDHVRIYKRLMVMRERFSLFPEYWYYLSCVSMETGHFKDGIEACDAFFRVNREIFRDDPMAGIVAYNKAFMLPKTEANKQEIRKCLELAKKSNSLRGDWQLDYLVAIMYKGVLNEQAKAEEMLETAIALLEQKSRSNARYGSKAGVTLKEGLRNCRNALHELRGESLEYDGYDESDELARELSNGWNITIKRGVSGISGSGRPHRIVFELPNDTFDVESSSFKLDVEPNLDYSYLGRRIFSEDKSERSPVSGRENYTAIVFSFYENLEAFSSTQLTLLHEHPTKSFKLIFITADKILDEKTLERGEYAYCKAFKEANPIRGLISFAVKGNFTSYASHLLVLTEIEVGAKRYPQQVDLLAIKNDIKRSIRQRRGFNLDF